MTSGRNLFFAIAIVAAVSMTLGGQGRGATDRIQKRSYVFKETNETLEYDVFVSSRVDPKKKSPLVIALHGAGVPPAAVLRSLMNPAEKGGYIMAAPMGYNLRGFYGAAGPGNTRGEPENLGELSEKDVMNVLGIVRQDFNVDEKRIYIAGQSMGGGGAIYLGVKYKQTWAAIAASAAAIPAQHQPDILEQIKEMPVILLHGTNDQAVPIDRVRPWVAKMKALKMPYEFHEIRQANHSDTIDRGAELIFNFFNKHTK
jgi:predicted peptidase